LPTTDRVTPIELTRLSHAVESALLQHPGVESCRVAPDMERQALGVTLLPRMLSAPVVDGHQRLQLDAGMAVVHQRTYEAQYLYREIFLDETYLQHGVRLHGHDVVLDIGANIGLFSLFVATRCPNATLHAFEPAPALFELLRTNLSLYAPHRCGVAGRDGVAEFTFYPNSSVFSGFHAEEHADRAAISHVIENAIVDTGHKPRGAIVEAMLRGRLDSERSQVQTRSLGSIIREFKLERIDLLKVDAERCEAEILGSLAAADWGRIQQMVIESHGGASEHQVLADMLRHRGFQSVVDDVPSLRATGFANIYAVREAKPPHRSAAERARRVTAGPGMLTEAAVTDLLRRCPGCDAVPIEVTILPVDSR
jgi:FkbM family methyltransferase